MSSTKSHRKKVLSIGKDCSRDRHDVTYSLDLSTDDDFACSQKSMFYQGSTAGFTKVICHNEAVFFALDQCRAIQVLRTEHLRNSFDLFQAISAQNTVNSWQKNYLKPAINLASRIFESQIVKFSGSNTVASKSVFEMSPDEFKKAVASKANDIIYQRWEKGLPLSIPAGTGHPANHFFHVYKDHSTKLVELDEASGKVNFIKQVV